MNCRAFTDQDLADLQCLARAFSDEQFDSYKEFAHGVAESGGCASRTRTAEERDQTYKDVLGILSKWDNGARKRAQGVVPCIVSFVAERRQEARNRNAGEFADLIALLASDPDFRRNDRAVDFLTQRHKWATSPLKKAENEKAAEVKVTNESNNLFKVFARLAQDFSTHTSDIALYNDRIGNPATPKGANGPDGDLSNGGRFILIRPSSRNENRFVAHGLKVAPHKDFPHKGKFIALYFSEKYRIVEGGKEADRRKTQGVCFFDGPHLVAIGRPENSAYFTYIIAKIDDREGLLDSFEAIIQTVNLRDERICAPALCLRCASKKDKHEKIGSFTRAQLLGMYSSSQRNTLEKWLAETPRPVLKL